MLRDIRNNYRKYELNENELSNNPIDLFDLWLKEALEENVVEPTVMVLSSVSDGQPDSRVVLLKELSAEGFVFYTNYLSTKGDQINENPRVALNFFWAEVERQVRVRGVAVKLGVDQARKYFETRPRDSQLGACASEQSAEVRSREELEAKFLEFERRYVDQSVPMPEYWGGYLVKPSEVEFWQGRPGRLHDRILYFQEEGKWRFKRLQP